jgi:hypothetical protein
MKIYPFFFPITKGPRNQYPILGNLKNYPPTVQVGGIVYSPYIYTYIVAGSVPAGRVGTIAIWVGYIIRPEWKFCIQICPNTQILIPARISIPYRKKMWNIAGDGLVLSLKVSFVQGRVDVVLSWWSSLLLLVPTVAYADRSACYQGRVFELAPLPCASQFR